MNLLIVSETQSYMMLTLKARFEAAGITVKLVKPLISEINSVMGEPGAIFFYADEPLMENSAGVIYARDKALDGDIPVFIAGNQNESVALEALVPKDILKKVFPRPMNIVDVEKEITDFLLSDASKPRKTILVIDDSGAMLRNVKGWLEDKYQVVLANSGAMGLKYVVSNKPDLILLDYEMPVIDGKQVLEILRSEPESEDIPVVFLTSKDDKAHVVNILNLKPTGYLLKTLPPEEIVKFIDEFFMKSRKL